MCNANTSSRKTHANLYTCSQGGLQDDDSSSTALTAYILISLLKSGVPLTPSLVNNALHCLEKGMAIGGDTTYTAALSTYALALLEHPRANDSLKLLMDRATRNHVRNERRRETIVGSNSLNESFLRISVRS